MSEIFLQGVIVISVAVAAFVGIVLSLTAMILAAKKKLSCTAPCRICINETSDLNRVVTSGQTLLTALTEGGISIPSPCGGKAACKQCRVQVLEGAGEALETDKGTFSRRELAEGWRLSCQFKVKNDLHVHIEERYLEVKEWIGTVVSNENVATFIKELIVELPLGESIPYHSGGYLQFHVPPFTTHTNAWKQTMHTKFYADWERFSLFDRAIDFKHLAKGEVIRAYSMASYPAEERTLKFNIRIATPPLIKGRLVADVAWGICSSYTFGLKPGDKLHLSGPYGESFMIQDERPLIFLIGGAGSSFGRSHILHLFRTEKTTRHVDLWYGARSLKENIYQQEYEQLAKEHVNFRYHLVLSEPLPEDQWPKTDPLRTNFLFRAFEQGQLARLENPEEYLYYVCGPPLHNSSVLKLLDDYGVPRENIVLDDFGS